MLSDTPIETRVRVEVEQVCRLLMRFSRESSEFFGNRFEPQKVSFKWIHGSGCVYLQISSTRWNDPQPFYLEYQVFSRADMGYYRMPPDHVLMIYSAIERTVAMHFSAGVVVWENHNGYCHGICSSPIILLCREFAGRLLCEDCIKSLSLMAPVVHRTGENNREKAERDKMLPSLRFSILEKYRFTCQACGRSAPEVKLHVDHKIPIAMGGLTIPENLHVLCSGCNLGKSATMPSQETLSFWESV